MGWEPVWGGAGLQAGGSPGGSTRRGGGFPGCGRGGAPAVTELEGEAREVPAAFASRPGGGMRPRTSESSAKVALCS